MSREEGHGLAEFLTKHADLKTRDGHRRVVRHGRLPEREIMTGIGLLAVRKPRVRDRETGAGRAYKRRIMLYILLDEDRAYVQRRADAGRLGARLVAMTRQRLRNSLPA